MHKPEPLSALGVSAHDLIAGTCDGHRLAGLRHMRRLVEAVAGGAGRDAEGGHQDACHECDDDDLEMGRAISAVKRVVYGTPLPFRSGFILLKEVDEPAFDGRTIGPVGLRLCEKGHTAG